MYEAVSADGGVDAFSAARGDPEVLLAGLADAGAQRSPDDASVGAFRADFSRGGNFGRSEASNKTNAIERQNSDRNSVRFQENLLEFNRISEI